jgi:hypothetical protein
MRDAPNIKSREKTRRFSCLKPALRRGFGFQQSAFVEKRHAQKAWQKQHRPQESQHKTLHGETGKPLQHHQV